MDDPVILALGRALALLARAFDRDGGSKVAEFAELLALFGVIAAEHDPRQGEILSVWAAIIADRRDG